MRKATHAILLFLIVSGAFLAGSWYSRRPIENGRPGDRKVLYYMDPMHPAYKSDKPGMAPDCGMELVAVYDDDRPADSGASPRLMATGTVQVSPEMQQLVGVRTGLVEKASGTYRVRLSGRVVPVETRVYAINAGIEGYIQDVSAATTGSQVRKNESLATFSAPNSAMTIQTYLLNLGAEDRIKQSAAEHSPEAQSLPAANANLQQRTQQLQNLGMSVLQMEEIKRTREVPGAIKILAPVDGFVLARNVSSGQKFERGAEWYRIANLDRVWIVADVSQNDAQYLRPGMSAQVSLPGRSNSFPARVSDTLPQFNPGSGTLKVRLEADNPGYLLRPDMFVEAQVSISFPAVVTVPTEAVLDSGLRKTVFVDRGEGFFEPREVKTGSRFEDRVEIVRGLLPGERIVVSGNFLISSESRLKAAGSNISAPVDEPRSPHVKQAEAEAQDSKDPACGMDVDKATALATGHTSAYRGQTYYFCSDSCKRNFDGNAEGYLKQVVVPGADHPSKPETGTAAKSTHRGRHG